jgi:Zn ribbon nucleic-acid-binding protein
MKQYRTEPPPQYLDFNKACKYCRAGRYVLQWWRDEEGNPIYRCSICGKHVIVDDREVKDQ